MADRGRDLTFSLLSDLDRFDLDDAARQLDTLADGADDAGRGLDQLERDADDAGRALDTGLSRDAQDAQRELAGLGDEAQRVDLEDKLGDDAKRAARKVDDAFDTISRASRSSARDVDDDTGRMKRSMGDVGNEASSTAREMAASFSGSSEDVVDAFQELGANAGEAFGPIGIAAGVAMAAGIGLIRAEAEKLKVLAEEYTEAMIENAGRLTEEAINSRIETMAVDDPEGFVKYNDAAERLGINIRDVARARAGDADAARRVIAAMDELDQAQRDEAAAHGNQVAQRSRATEALAGLRRELGRNAEAARIAQEATSTFGTATESAGENAARGARVAGGAWDDMRSDMREPVRARVDLVTPSADAIWRVRQNIINGLGDIKVAAGVVNAEAASRYRYKK